jgi:hypothetical protein
MTNKKEIADDGSEVVADRGWAAHADQPVSLHCSAATRIPPGATAARILPSAAAAAISAATAGISAAAAGLLA